MALDKDILGNALKTMAANFNDQDPPEDAIELETRRLNFWKGVAEQIIEHIKTAGEVNVQVNTTGTAAAQTGTGTGTMT